MSDNQRLLYSVCDVLGFDNALRTLHTWLIMKNITEEEALWLCKALFRKYRPN